MWYLLCLLTGQCICSSSSGLEAACLKTVLPAGALPFLRAGESGVVRSAMADLAGVGAGAKIGTSAGSLFLDCRAVELAGAAALGWAGPMGWRWSLDGMGWVATEKVAAGVASGWAAKNVAAEGNCK
ncbi:hypothetical protein V6N12_062114 [Hibiscus sabdariffa]|uniref:Secreted protein n=1 Tax=Hibiscus sabdariffa TaxID=183260 RepID=A0ABR2F7W7_9ROSI